MNAISNAACSALVRFLAARARWSRAPGRPSEVTNIRSHNAAVDATAMPLRVRVLDGVTDVPPKTFDVEVSGCPGCHIVPRHVQAEVGRCLVLTGSHIVLAGFDGLAASGALVDDDGRLGHRHHSLTHLHAAQSSGPGGLRALAVWGPMSEMPSGQRQLLSSQSPARPSSADTCS